MNVTRYSKEAKPNMLTQGFHDKHKANDFGGKYGEFLVAPFNCKITKIITAQKLDESNEERIRGYGITMVSIEDPKLSCTYWHCLPFFAVSEGDTVLQGKPVAQMGNSGFVMVNGKYVEIDIRTIPPYKGTHLHLVMRRQDGEDFYPIDPMGLINWTIPVNYSVLDAVALFLKKIMDFLK